MNVWTPGLDEARRPVLVWIHGGGFLIGSGATPIYSGRDLARRGDVVVVTINYRLGALGYTHLRHIFGPDFADSSNLGVRDQIAALEWVRDNIDGFGGDPDNVTVFGQSAGAMSIGALLGSPRARPLFHRVICQSGAAQNVLDSDEAAQVAQIFIEELRGPAPSYENLGRIPVERILEAQRATMRRVAGWTKLMSFQPAVDGDLIPEAPLEAVRRGEAQDVSLLIGTTLEEWWPFRVLDRGLRPMGEEGLIERIGRILEAEFPAAPDAEIAVRALREALGLREAGSTPDEVWSAFQSTRVFHWPSAELAESHHKAGGRAYGYLFTWRPPALRRAVGACHAIDIPFVFGSTTHAFARPLTGLTSAASRLSRKIQRAWCEFARNGHPGHEQQPAWDSYEVPQRATMILGRECSLADAPLEAERRLLATWSRVD